MSGESTSFSATWTGDAADQEIVVNGIPKAVEVINYTDNIRFKKTDLMAAGACKTIIADGTMSTVAAGIEFDGQIVRVLAALNINAKVFHLIAYT